MWAWVTTATRSDERRRLLIRRNRTTGELAFYLCWSPLPVRLHTPRPCRRLRWSIEQLFQIGKGQVGLDHYQVRGWTGWHRFITLAVLATLAAQQPDTDPEIIALTVAEIRRFPQRLRPRHTATARANPALVDLATNIPQARARQSHYQRRLAHDASRKIK
ncbi:hypothetical protein [Micromonospora sp. NPDC005299]|uniref:hypothetical protein n=1 Tax=Micromonospora sp. NPDC005299 TaxID=3364231 RepID=UPI0036CF96C4